MQKKPRKVGRDGPIPSRTDNRDAAWSDTHAALLFKLALNVSPRFNRHPPTEGASWMIARTHPPLTIASCRNRRLASRILAAIERSAPQP